MEYGPLPPHERTWRHPSELAAEEHALARAETTGTSTRAFAFTTGTLGLLAVGLLIVAVTPGRNAAPVAVSATTTPIAADGTAFAFGSTTSDTERAPLGLRSRPDALATPIEEGRFAVVSDADLDPTGSAVHVGASIEVQVPSGRTHDARVVGSAGDTVLVELERSEPGVELATAPPADHEIVTVMAEPPVTIEFADLPTLDVAEGTAVLDDDGDLVGLCSQSAGATRLLKVTSDVTSDANSDLSGDASTDRQVPPTTGAHTTSAGG